MQMKSLTEFFKKRQKRKLKKQLERLEAKLMESDIKLGVFMLYHEKIAYKMAHEAYRLEKKRYRRVRDYVV
jgi:signal recognition particle GTPase